MVLKKIGKLKRFFGGNDSHAVVSLESGYRNDQGERTQVGLHQFINFLEEHEQIGPAFQEWLKGKRDAAKVKATARRKAEKDGDVVEDEDED